MPVYYIPLREVRHHHVSLSTTLFKLFLQMLWIFLKLSRNIPLFIEDVQLTFDYY